MDDGSKATDSISLPPQLWQQHWLGNRSLHHSWTSVSRRETGNPDSFLWLHFFPYVAPNTEQRTEHTKMRSKGGRGILQLSKIFQCSTFSLGLIDVGLSSQNCLYLEVKAFTLPEGSTLTFTPSSLLSFLTSGLYTYSSMGKYCKEAQDYFPKYFHLAHFLASRRISKVFKEFWWNF